MSNSEDEFNIFNQILSLEASPSDLGSSSLATFSPYQEVADTSSDMGIQCKPRSTLHELLESQPRRDVPKKASQTRLPAPPPT